MRPLWLGSFASRVGKRADLDLDQAEKRKTAPSTSPFVPVLLVFSRFLAGKDPPGNVLVVREARPGLRFCAELK